MESKISTIIGAIGRFLIGLGLTVLAFAGYQLWGTGLQEERAQNALEDEFEQRQATLQELLAESGITTTTLPSGVNGSADGSDPEDSRSTPTTAPEAEPVPISLAPELARELLPQRGEVLGNIRIPAIDVDKHFVFGVGRDDLRSGPGHYPSTPLPGQAGNAAIAGHRTTYGQPFHNLDLLAPGDLIEVETLQGVFFYEVMGHATSDGVEIGHFIVDPTQTDVVQDKGDNRLTLTACHPKFSARQRIIVTARMVSAPAAPLPMELIADNSGQLGADEGAPESGAEAAGEGGQTPRVDENEDEGNTVGISEESLEESLGWHFEELNATLLWSALCLLILLAGYLLGRSWKRIPAYALTALPFLLVLFITFGHLDRMLPAL